MAVLGNGGKLKLKRTPPPPVAFGQGNVDLVNRSISVGDTDFRTADLVEVASTRNWPLTESLTQNPLVANYEIHGTVDRLTEYPAALEAIRPIPINQLFIHVDQLYRISFYRTRAKALNGALADREALDNVLPTDTLELRLVNEWFVECSLKGWSLNMQANEIDTTGLGNRFNDGVRGLIQGGGTFDFVLENAFKESTSGAVTQDYESTAQVLDILTENNEPLLAGDYYMPIYQQLLVNNQCTFLTTEEGLGIASGECSTYSFTGDLFDSSKGVSNALALMLNMQDQSEAEAEFWMYSNREGFPYNECPPIDGVTYVPGDLYYTCDVLLTRSVVEVGSDEAITGSVSFVTVRDVELREGWL